MVGLTIAYDGTDFHGLAPNPGVKTVVGEISVVLNDLLGYIPEIIMSGRTDTGVHAWGQILSFSVDCSDRLGLYAAASAERAGLLRKLRQGLNKRLAPMVVVRDVRVMPSDFSARFSAKARHYRYKVLSSDVANPFLARTSWWIPEELDVEAMNEAAQYFVGEHDFSSFCRKPKHKIEPISPPSLVRQVLNASWGQDGDLLVFTISGTAFCHQMVRSLVGMTVAVGKRKRSANEIPDVLAAKDRAVAAPIAPPHGLTLWQVDY